ncbi:S1 family peptidase [Streptomyces sp. AK010]|uniref:S1 family peptidase n=1 Tax=Streptomyces sp. AK010 TaxID=2723074 RepID=UPI00160CBE3B|nr:S1 family peptidase [Streptomyces sp. AK010]MBB6417875.1 streptogrisin D [Streptomyces sp. AK010]
MRRHRMHRAGILGTVGGLLAVLMAPSAHAAPAPLTDPARAAAVAAKLGDNRTAGVYYKNGQLVVAVTDQAAAASVRSAGGTAEIVRHSAAQLDSIHSELDQLAGIPNTSWGVDPSSNQVTVKIYAGVSAADRARIERVAADQGDAVRIESRSGKLERTAYTMRGGLGIVSDDWLCTAGFNVQNSSGEKFMLTAGHCMVGGNYTWYRYSGNIKLGTMVDWEYEPGDWAIIDYTNPDVTPYGTVQYKDGSEGQITNSRWVSDGEKVKRVGTVSQDLDGMVLEPSTTVNYTDGATLYNMIETSLCVRHGDSGGPMFTGTTALGINSGGN